MDTLLYLMFDLFAVYCTYRFLGLFFNKTNISRKFEFLIYALYFLLRVSIYLLFKNPFLNLFVNVSAIFLLTLMYISKLKTKLIATVLLYGLAMLLDIVAYNIVAKVIISLDIGKLTNVISNILFFMVVLIFERIFNYQTNQEIRFVHWVAIFLIPIGSIIIVVVAFLSDYDPLYNIICVAILLSINAVTFYLFNSVIKIYEEKYKNEVLKNQIDAYMNQFEIIKSSQENMRTLKHDFKNHLIAMMNLMTNAKYEDAVKYTEGIIDRTEVKGDYVSSGNSDIDSILNYKIAEAEKAGADIDINVAVPPEMKIDIIDLNIILGNLIDNSINALRRSNEKHLKIDIELNRSVIYITVTNSFDGDIKYMDGKLLTTKKDKDNHGIGISSIQRTLDKYNGTMNIDYTDSFFTVSMLLYSK